MTSDANIEELLTEHLPYEVEMLGVCFGKMHGDLDRIPLNMAIECFGIHARVLKLFLTNEGDSRNFKANSVSETYKASRKDHGAFNKLDEQIAHLSKNRTRNKAEKFNTERAQRVYIWLFENIRRFTDTLRVRLRMSASDKIGAN